MKKLSLLIIFFAMNMFTLLSNVMERSVTVYSPVLPSARQLYLQMSYGSALITNAPEAAVLENAQILAVEIVYTDDPKGQDLRDLNSRRIAAVRSLVPRLKGDKSVAWQLVKQEQCTDKPSASKLFHGVVISYRPAPGPETMALEKEELKKALHPSTGGGWRLVTMGSDTISYEVYEGTGGAAVGYFNGPDSCVTAVLNRNKWKDMAIAADLTGSMSPYTSQLLLWFKLETNKARTRQLVFFNDGDNKADQEKKIGETGGIYHSKATTFSELEALAMTTMSAGSGGDIPENNIEALLKTSELCPDCSNVIMIADNWANIKDIELMSKLSVPVKVIVCGAVFGVNVQYLELARATGGSVHTMEEDLTNLIKMNEGETIKIGAYSFIIKNGKFERLTDI